MPSVEMVLGGGAEHVGVALAYHFVDPCEHREIPEWIRTSITLVQVGVAVTIGVGQARVGEDAHDVRAGITRGAPRDC